MMPRVSIDCCSTVIARPTTTATERRVEAGSPRAGRTGFYARRTRGSGPTTSASPVFLGGLRVPMASVEHSKPRREQSTAQRDLAS